MADVSAHADPTPQHDNEQVIGGGAASRQNLAHVALEALVAERDLAVTVTKGRTPAANRLLSIDSLRDAAIRDLGLQYSLA